MTYSRLLRCMVATVFAATALSTQAVAAEPKMKQIGIDAAFDAAPAVDLTYLKVGRAGDKLEVRFGLNGMLPVQGSYPQAGIEWAFKSAGRTFVAEGHPDAGTHFFTLFEVQGGALSQIAILEGSFEAEQGYMVLWVPLNEIGASKGTRVVGARLDGSSDVDIHQHAGPVSPVVDSMTTSQGYIVR